MVRRPILFSLATFAAISFLIDTVNGSLSIYLLSPAQADSHISRTKVDGDTTIQTFYDEQQIFLSQVRTSVEGDTKVIRTVDATGAQIEIKRITETPIGNDPTVVNDDPSIISRVETTKKYLPGRRVPYETVVLQEKTKLLATTNRVATEYSRTMKTYSRGSPRKLIKTVIVNRRLLRIDEFGFEIGEGTRITTTPESEVVEELDPKTQLWKVVENKNEPENEDTSGASLSSGQQCAAAKATLEELTTEEQELQDARRTLAAHVNEFRNDIEMAKSWKGMPERIDLELVRSPDNPDENRWECPRCGGPEKSLIQSLHAKYCVDGANAVYHPEALPRAVEEFRWVYEANLRLEYEEKKRRGKLCGNSIGPSGIMFYTDWGLRDQYLKLREPTLKLNIDNLVAMDAQLTSVRELLLMARNGQVTSCKKPKGRFPAAFGQPQQPGEQAVQAGEPAKDCNKPGIVGAMDCVDEQLGD